MNTCHIPHHRHPCSSLASALAAHLNKSTTKSTKLLLIEGDDYHPLSSIEKMAQGHPLTDDDRRPWLSAIAAALKPGCIVACSALKPEYRRVLQSSAIQQHAKILFILLEPSIEDVQHRLEQRPRGSHFFTFSPTMVSSQQSTLEYEESELFMKFTSPMPPIAHIVQSIAAKLQRVVCMPYLTSEWT